MAITDYWLNPLLDSAQVGSVLGYNQTTEEFPHDLYSFFLSSVRDADIKQVRLWYRFLLGMQREWESIYGKILTLPLLYSAEFCHEEYLDYLKVNVGITDELDYLWGTLSTNEKRRMIRSFVAFLLLRSTNIGVIQMIETMTGRKTQIKDYFDYRWILSGDEDSEMETAIGREERGYDPWLLSEDTMPVGIKPDSIILNAVGSDYLYIFRVQSLIDAIEDPPVQPNPRRVRMTYRPTKQSFTGYPVYALGAWGVSPPLAEYFGQTATPYSTNLEDFRVAYENDSYVFDIRTMDNDGTMNRDMVEAIARFSRPFTERIYVRYLYLIEEFDEDELNNWTEGAGTLTFDADNDEISIESTTLNPAYAISNVDGDDEWISYSFGARCKNMDKKYIELQFFWQDDENYMYFRATPDTPPAYPAGAWEYGQVVMGVRTPKATGDLDWFDLEVEYYWRVVSFLSENDTLVTRVYQDENLLSDHTISVPWADTKGKIGIAVDANGEVIVSHIEVHPYPMDSTYIGP